MRVEPSGDPADVLVRAPVEHHEQHVHLKLDVEDLSETLRLADHLRVACSGNERNHRMRWGVGARLLERGGRLRRLGIEVVSGEIGHRAILEEEAHPRAHVGEGKLGKPAIRDDCADDQRLAVGERGARAAARAQERRVRVDERVISEPRSRVVPLREQLALVGG